MVQLLHLYMTTRNTIALTIRTLQSDIAAFNTLSRFVIAFLPTVKWLLISWLQALSAMILEPKKIKSVTSFTLSLPICHEVMELDAMILVFWMLSFKPTFSLSSFTLIKRLFSFSSLPLERYHLQDYIYICVCVCIYIYIYKHHSGCVKVVYFYHKGPPPRPVHAFLQIA